MRGERDNDAQTVPPFLCKTDERLDSFRVTLLYIPYVHAVLRRRCPPFSHPIVANGVHPTVRFWQFLCRKWETGGYSPGFLHPININILDVPRCGTVHNSCCPERCFPVGKQTPEESDDSFHPLPERGFSHFPGRNNPSFSPLFAPRREESSHR